MVKDLQRYLLPEKSESKTQILKYLLTYLYLFLRSVAICAGMPPEKMLPLASQVVTLLNRKQVSQNLSVLFFTSAHKSSTIHISFAV